MQKIRIFLAEDHGVVRAGIRSLIEREADCDVVGEAERAEPAIAAVRSLLPDLVVLDLSLPPISGADLTRELVAAHPAVRVLVLTMQENPGYIPHLVAAGAVGYVQKRCAGEELIRAIRAVYRGETYFDPQTSNRLISVMVQCDKGGNPVASALSPREDEVLRNVALGYTNKEIAAKMELSPKTVETYKARSMEKLGLRNRVDVVRFARESQW